MGEAMQEVAIVPQDGRAANSPAIICSSTPLEWSGRVHCGARCTTQKGRTTFQAQRSVPGANDNVCIRG